MGFLSLGLRVVMDMSCQSCSGIPGEHIFSKRIFLILILTTLACHINALTSTRLEVNKSRSVVMIVVSFELSDIKFNGMTGRSH